MMKISSIAQARAVAMRRLAVAATAAGALLLAPTPPVGAQDGDLRSLASQVERLQRELSDLQRTVYAGAAPSGAVAGGGGGGLDASQEVRIQQLESQISGLTGQVEELGYQVTRLGERVDALAEAVGNIMRGDGQAPADQPADQPMADLGTGAGAAPATGSGSATAAPEPPTQPHTLGTLTQEQLDAARDSMPQPGAEAAAQGAAQTAAAPTAAYQLPGNTPDEQYQYAFGLLRQANYPEAEQALRAFIERNPSSPLAGNAQYWLGETYYVRGDFQNAAVAFAEGYQKYPDSGKAPDNLLKLGMSLGQIGARDDACTTLGELAKQFPGAPANIKERAERERTRLGCG